MLGRNKEACLADETAAQDTLKQNWSKYAANDKTQCIGMVTTGGPASYVELLSCIEIMRDARVIENTDPLESDLGTPASGPVKRCGGPHRVRRPLPAWLRLPGAVKCSSKRLSKLIDARQVIHAQTLPQVQMPNRNGFILRFAERMPPDRRQMYDCVT